MEDIVQNKVPDLFGICCYLTELTEDDTDFIISLRTNQNLNALSGKSLSPEEHLSWLKNYYQKDNDFYWVVRDIKSNKRIGTAALFDIDNRSRKAESGRTIILEDYRFLTFDVFLTRMKFAFDNLNLNKVYAKVRLSEQKILNFDKKLGYKVDGILREDWWDGEKFIDFYLISMLKSEFNKYRLDLYPKYLKILKSFS
jgi:RimJ/RimL family protein N-acetyltransferase